MRWRSGPFHEFLLWLVVFVSTFLLLHETIPFSRPHEVDVDEGINLMKSLLYRRGHALYQEIWSDQPPFFTAVLRWWFHFTAESVAAGRLLVMLFSAWLSASLFHILYRSRGWLAGISGVTFLLLSSLYVKYSGAVMIGIPALSLAMFAVHLIVLQEKSELKRILFYLSSVVFAAAMLTKLSVLILIPSIVAALCVGEKNWLKRLVLWGVATTGSLILLTLLIAPSLPHHLLQLADSHINEFGRSLIGGTGLLAKFIKPDRDLLFLGALGIVLGIVVCRFDFLFPFIWLVSGICALSVHRPLWPHHYPVLGIPLAWLAALGVDNIFRRSTATSCPFTKATNKKISATSSAKFWHRAPEQQSNRGGNLISLVLWCSVALLLKIPGLGPVKGYATSFRIRPKLEFTIRILMIGLLVWSVFRLPIKDARMRKRVQKVDERLNQAAIAQLRNYQAVTRWVVSDRPIYPFMAQLPVPPEIAVASSKRRHAGELPDSLFLEVIDRYQPEQIIFERFKGLGATILAHAEDRYATIHYDGRTLIMLRRDLMKPTTAQP